MPTPGWAGAGRGGERSGSGRPVSGTGRAPGAGGAGPGRASLCLRDGGGRDRGEERGRRAVRGDEALSPRTPRGRGAGDPRAMPAARPGREPPPQREYRTASAEGRGEEPASPHSSHCCAAGERERAAKGVGCPAGCASSCSPSCRSASGLGRPARRRLGRRRKGPPAPCAPGWPPSPRCRRRPSAGPPVPAPRCAAARADGRKGTFDRGGRLIRAVPSQNPLASTFFFYWWH